jgi:hypothetical protein
MRCASGSRSRICTACTSSGSGATALSSVAPAASRSTSAPLERLWEIACATLASRPVAFVFARDDAHALAPSTDLNHPHTGATT